MITILIRITTNFNRVIVDELLLRKLRILLISDGGKLKNYSLPNP